MDGAQLSLSACGRVSQPYRYPPYTALISHRAELLSPTNQAFEQWL
ncbi:TPA: DUF1281 domain-containing protein [Escherichia coli]|nr:DUF1281 domain-containing protein [Escherichia coli]